MNLCLFDGAVRVAAVSFGAREVVHARDDTGRVARVHLCIYRVTARTRRRRAMVLLLLRSRRGSRLGGIPSFSAAVSDTQSSALSAASAATARLGGAIRLLGQLDHAGGLGRRLAARHWPQFRQIVVPIAGSVVGHRIEGVLPRP
jgi:hypothetical protein